MNKKIIIEAKPNPPIFPKELKRVEWVEVEKISKSEDKSQPSIQ